MLKLRPRTLVGYYPAYGRCWPWLQERFDTHFEKRGPHSYSHCDRTAWATHENSLGTLLWPRKAQWICVLDAFTSRSSTICCQEPNKVLVAWGALCQRPQYLSHAEPLTVPHPLMDSPQTSPGITPLSASSPPGPSIAAGTAWLPRPMRRTYLPRSVYSSLPAAPLVCSPAIPFTAPSSLGPNLSGSLSPPVTSHSRSFIIIALTTKPLPVVPGRSLRHNFLEYNSPESPSRFSSAIKRIIELISELFKHLPDLPVIIMP